MEANNPQSKSTPQAYLVCIMYRVFGSTAAASKEEEEGGGVRV